MYDASADLKNISIYNNYIEPFAVLIVRRRLMEIMKFKGWFVLQAYKKNGFLMLMNDIGMPYVLPIVLNEVAQGSFPINRDIVHNTINRSKRFIDP